MFLVITEEKLFFDLSNNNNESFSDLRLVISIFRIAKCNFFTFFKSLLEKVSDFVESSILEAINHPQIVISLYF